MELKNIEFYGTPKGEVMIVDGVSPARVYEESDKNITNTLLERIEDFYPGAYKALSEMFVASQKNWGYYRYRMAHRFIRCNFKAYDSTSDVDQNGVFRFEFIDCPLKGDLGECKYCGIICNPKFDSNLTEREAEVMKMYYESANTEEIADALVISIETVRKHKRNALVKLKLHSLKDFISYASRNKMYEEIE